MLLLAELPVAAAGAEARDELFLRTGQGGGQCRSYDLSPSYHTDEGKEEEDRRGLILMSFPQWMGIAFLKRK